MRGQKTQIAKKKIDVVLISARYDAAGERLEFARGHARQGQVWGDIRLYPRKQVVQLLENGRVVVTGKPQPPVGDFEVFGPIRLGPAGQLLSDESSSGIDDLGLPVL